MKGQVHLHSSDGTGNDLAIVDGDGNKISNVTEATVTFRYGELSTVDLTIIAPGVNVKATIDDVTFVMPCCGTIVAHNCRTKKFEHD